MSNTEEQQSDEIKELASKWSRARRIEFIDFRLCVDGKINRADLVDFFGISIPQSSLDLSYYKSLVKQANPPRENLQYDNSKKGYLRTDDFKPIFPSLCNSDVILNDLYNVARDKLSTSENFFGYTPDVGIATLEPPKRIIDDKSLINIIDAIRGKMAVHIVYKSLDGEKDDDYLIAPHSFAFDGIRWHMRAYCFTKHNFRDYVLSRVKKADVPKIVAPSDRFPDPVGNGFKEVGTSAFDDVDWNTNILLKLKANPNLDEKARRAIELDYGLPKDGVLDHPVKRALLIYALNSLKLGKEYASLDDRLRQLVLVNEDEVEAAVNELTNK
ncbi:MAG: WYL domain-containing protein [Succinivibrio sp.]|nr:WYL domain-containing protein [Succinivibrio sp.]